MFTKYLSRLSAMAVATVVVFSLSGCNKSTASIPAASPDATVETTTEIETVETSGENLVSSESATEESTTKKSADKETKTGTTERTTGSKEPSSKANDVETTTQAATTKAAATTTETTTQKTTEAATQAQTEKATEKITEATTQKQTEKTTEVHKHNYTSFVTKASTCTSEGVMTYRCSCGDSYTETIGKTAHSFGSYTYNNDATTSADGTKTRYCLVCGETETVTSEGTKKSLPSWYDEHWQQLNTTMGAQDDGSLEAYYVGGQFSWTDAALGCWDFGYSAAEETVGEFAEGWVHHGYLFK